MRRLALVLLAVSSAVSAEARHLSVLELRNKLEGTDRKLVDGAYLTDRLRAEVLDAKLGLQVMTRENMLVLLQAQGKSLENCEGECEVDTARRLGADLVVSGELLRLGAQLKASLKLHDAKSGALLGAVSASGVDVEALDASLPAAVHRLLASLEVPEAPRATVQTAPVRAPPAALPAPSNDFVTMTIPAPPEGKWVLVTEDGSVVCNLPCKQRLNRGSKYYAERDEGVVAERTRIAIPQPAGFAAGRSAEATYYSSRGSKTGGILLATLGLSVGAWGVGSLTSEDTTFNRALVGGGAVVAVGGLVLGFLDRDEHYEGALTLGQARSGGQPAALAWQLQGGP